MKKIIMSVLLVLGSMVLSTTAYAEKILCADTKHQKHIVEFISDYTEFVYVDNISYTYEGIKDSTVTYVNKGERKKLEFVVDVKNRSWFHLRQLSIPKNKDEKVVEHFWALCDNVHLLKEEPKPTLVTKKDTL